MFALLVLSSLSLSLVSTPVAEAAVYNVALVSPANAALVDPTPVGVSFEFFMWPSYMTNVTPPVQCLKQLDKVYGQKTPIRIGGTTQDRALYDPDFKGYVNYHVDGPLDPPLSLTYGPKFFDLIGELGAPTVLGLNRGSNNRSNTFAALQVAKAKVARSLTAIELGNEPDVYAAIWNLRPEPWTDVEEAAEQADWAQELINKWKSPLPILSAGVYAVSFQITATWPTTRYLIETAFNSTIKSAVKFYCNHLYTTTEGRPLSDEMNHAATVRSLAPQIDSVAAAASVGNRHIIGETNFHVDEPPQDRTFGSALQTLDKSLLGVATGVQRLYFHQGTVNSAPWNWWSNDLVEPPFYGGYFAALALARSDQIVAIDSGLDSYAQYVVYKRGKPIRAVMINTDYYSGTGVRNSTTFTLTGLRGSKSLESLRLTAPSSDFIFESGQRPGSGITVGGSFFSNSDCALRGNQKLETTQQKAGIATFTLMASESLIVYL
ncbi:hypothetical protein BKA61DRAFT_711299 [Leptodontidium sp. MPI-SDFR-AT-0119]|nr:hypothetical protein BKA61DRAFT_711299 [Leptodontidium sp. MPI-SDFR-AT-0119]